MKIVLKRILISCIALLALNNIYSQELIKNKTFQDIDKIKSLSESEIKIIKELIDKQKESPKKNYTGLDEFYSINNCEKGGPSYASIIDIDIKKYEGDYSFFILRVYDLNTMSELYFGLLSDAPALFNILPPSGTSLLVQVFGVTLNPTNIVMLGENVYVVQ